MSEIKVNSIKGVAASTAALTINNTDGTCTANLTNRTNKNLIINCSMIVSQRNGTSAVTFKMQAKVYNSSASLDFQNAAKTSQVNLFEVLA